jgi:hypothetical protein
MLEPNREFWQYFQKKKNVEMWPLENQNNTCFEPFGISF